MKNELDFIEYESNKSIPQLVDALSSNEESCVRRGAVDAPKLISLHLSMSNIFTRSKIKYSPIERVSDTGTCVNQLYSGRSGGHGDR